MVGLLRLFQFIEKKVCLPLIFSIIFQLHHFYLKVWGMPFSDKIFKTKIQRPQIFVCKKYFIELYRTTKQKNYFAGIYLFYTKKWKT